MSIHDRAFIVVLALCLSIAILLILFLRSRLAMREFRIDGSWCLDEHGMRVGHVSVDSDTKIHKVTFYDDRFIQSGDKLMRLSLGAVEVSGNIKLS